MLITKSRFGALAAAVPISDGTGLPVFNTGLAFVLPGGAKGLRLTHLHVGASLITDASALNVSSRLVVANGSLPPDIEQYQAAFEPNAFAAFPESGVDGFQFDVLYHAIYGNADMAGNQIVNAPDHADFNDWTGPGVGPNESLIVMLFPIFTTETIAALGNDLSIFLQMNVFGKNLDGDPIMGRAIPRYQVGSR